MIGLDSLSTYGKLPLYTFVFFGEIGGDQRRLRGSRMGKPSRSNALRILIVDDNRDTALGLALLLQRDGHDVRFAQSGLEALEHARSYFPNVVLLDIGLPGLNGFNVAERMRREESCKGTSIIAISGYSHEENQRRAWEAGIDDFLVKPIDYDVLTAMISQAIVSPR